jgi:hypothetical protein
LMEQTVRSLKLRRHLRKYLPKRTKRARHGAEEVGLRIIQGLLLGGRGLQGGDGIREDDLLAEILCQDGGLPSPAPVYGALCEMAGISADRAQEEWYKPGGPRMASLKMTGEERKLPAMRRQVPDSPEAAASEKLRQLAGFLRAVAVACARALPTAILRVAGFAVVFGDGTDLEAEGNCFDAAQWGREGKRILRWLTLMAGPVIAGQRLMPGNSDEGREMPWLLEETRETVGELAGRKARILALLDAAYFEWLVVEWLLANPWHFIICANPQREMLTRLAQEQPESVWSATGGDAARGWIQSEVACLGYGAATWDKTVTIIARRWREEGDLREIWHYSFVGTNLEPSDLPAEMVGKHGYAQAVWMLYGTKQGRENHYKTALEDLGLHHPPSGRLGVAQAFYALASAAHNVAMVMRYRVAPKEESGITLWRLRQGYFAIAGYLVRRGRRLLVRLSGAVDVGRQIFWQEAFAEARRL